MAPSAPRKKAARAPLTERRSEAQPMLRMRELARRSGVPASTIKHYLREGLLPEGAIRASRNSALYDPSLVERVKLIKEMQRTQFLPLWRIREVLAGKRNKDIATVEAAVGRAGEDLATGKRETRAVLLARGLRAEELRELERLELIDEVDPVTGADLRLVDAIIEARASGLTRNLDTVRTLREYTRAVRALARAELAIFGDVIPGSDDQLAPLTDKALAVSETIVRVMRQRLLLQELAAMAALPKRRRAKASS